MQKLLSIVAFLLFATFSAAIRWSSEKDADSGLNLPSAGKNVCDVSELSDLLRRSSAASFDDLHRRQDSGSDDGSAPADSVGVALGSATVKAKLGNINITVKNVTISTGKIDVQDITIGNITVLVNVNLAELGKLLPIGNLTLPQLPSVSLPITLPTLVSSSTQVEGSTVITTVTPTATDTLVDDRIRRDATNIHLGPRQTSVPSLPSASVDIKTGDIVVDAEIGNITLSVDTINVTIGDVTLKNISIGNILVLVNLGTQADLSNLTNLVAGVTK